MMMKSRLTILALACMTVATVHAQNAPAGSLAAAAQKAISNNPEVTARLNALRAAGNEADVARGGYYPRVDLTADVGRDSNRITTNNPESTSFSRNGLALSANQLLWDGQATRKEVERLGHARVTRYFEFLAATEDTALEAARAYIDVQRYRKLVSLAEDNYVQHKYAFDQLASKVKAGVGRGVDSEQANARLALADSNLTTEVANLHDVSARYLRIVGEAPAGKQPNPSGLDRGIPAGNSDTVNQALSRHASISAAVENLRAVQAQATSKESAYQPKVEARARAGVGKNFDGVQNQKRDSSVQLVLNWNLYNGGSDQARVRQYTDLINQAADQRDKACRDVRQTVAIAHNDIKKLKDQLAALDRNVLAIEKARDAYRQQFDIGQRSLLDLLNAENELYTAKRSYANAEYDLQLAYARTQAARNTLTSTLGLTSNDDGNQSLVRDWQAADDAAQRCPVSTVDASSASREELDARARKLAGPAVAAPVVTPAPVAAKAEPVVADEAAAETVAQRLRDWAAAWMSKDVDRYFSYYAKDFAPAKSTSAKWISERRRLVTKPGPIEVSVGDIKAVPKGDSVVTSFQQNYSSANFKDKTNKVLTWKMIDGQWVIVKESNR
ncbi:MAG TPA: TolC family outer membrane protein [Aquabacterium sp.]|uniref:TolC family outer membrane protein n=1 Tax=Aquabacterium sp. TaxID=1872578 RepID=UPI002E327780|nr:TolC family outer membrane protein [Aquabacterium sp.]HEX5355518.1 TolC family outer membrane protein [Aquabacterium sp.]